MYARRGRTDEGRRKRMWSACVALSIGLLLFVSPVLAQSTNTPTDTPTDTPTFTATPTETPTPTGTPTHTATGTSTPTPTITPTATPTPTPTPVPDRDGDGVPDAADNCPDSWNPAQSDADGNRIGDMCDPGFARRPLLLQQVRLQPARATRGSNNGTILVKGLIDATEWGGLAGFAAAITRGVAVHLDGAGLVPPGQTIAAGPCGAACAGAGGGTATFVPRKSSNPNLVAMKVTAQRRTFPALLNPQPLTVTLSLGGLDRRDQIGSCTLSRTGRANCRKP